MPDMPRKREAKLQAPGAGVKPEYVKSPTRKQVLLDEETESLALAIGSGYLNQIYLILRFSLMSQVGSAVPTSTQATGTPTKPEGVEVASGEGKPQQKKKSTAPEHS